MEKLKVQGHSAEYIKRLAKKIRRQNGVLHHVALDLASQTCGFKNWANFQNNKFILANESQAVLQKVGRLVPEPATLPYRMFSMKNAEKRPNARMSIAAHQEIARLLKEALAISPTNKTANTAIGQVRTTLDDWCQLEYPNRSDLPNDVFQAMYYGDNQFKREWIPSDKRKLELIDILSRVEAIISIHYHPCQPVKWIHQRFALAKTWIRKWPKGKKNLEHNSRLALIPGTFVHIRGQKELLIVIAHDESEILVSCYGNKGNVFATRSEIIIFRDQSVGLKFVPAILYLPYGKWIFEDGSQILFNREYCPLWLKTADGSVKEIDPDTWVNLPKTIKYIFKDNNIESWENKNESSASRVALKEWGVRDRLPRLVNQLAIAINTGDLNQLIPNDVHKLYSLGSN